MGGTDRGHAGGDYEEPSGLLAVVGVLHAPVRRHRVAE